MEIERGKIYGRDYKRNLCLCIISITIECEEVINLCAQIQARTHTENNIQE